RIGEVRVIQDVEEIGPKLHRETLRNRRSLVQREVPLLEGWAMQRVAAFIAEVSCTWDTIARHASCGRNVHRAWNRKGSEINIIHRIARMVYDRPDDVWAVEAAAAAAVVVFEIVV